MIITDSISNFFSNIVNSSKANKYKVIQSKSTLIINVLNVLLKKGLINGYSFLKENKNYICIYLKYNKNKPVITSIKRISKPGKRVYIKNKYLFQNSHHLLLLSTSKGILTELEAKKYNIGGEILCKIK